MEDIIARFKESCGKVGNMIKEFIARFKKARAAFVRTWKFEKDVGSTTERVRKEVDGEWQEIGKKKWYALRKKHGERLATALRAKED